MLKSPHPIAKTGPGLISGLLIVALLLIARPGWSTTILEMDIDEISRRAALIFEGEILAHDVRKDDRSDMIHTYVTFAVNDVIKGDYQGQTLELRFSGGSLNGQVMEVSGLTIPAVGEQGIYFVEALGRNLLNPLLGWSQGHFLIEHSDGERHMTSVDKTPITDVQSMAELPRTIRKSQIFVEGKSDVAAGVSTDTTALSSDRALSVEEFKTRIRGFIEP